MATPAGTLRVGPYLTSLVAIVVVLYGIVFWPGQRHTPKLGLDLEGGLQVIFKAKTDNGQAPTKSAMNEARQIMDERVNGLGVSEAEVVIQGSDTIVISVPGKTADLSSIGGAAKLNFRGLVMPAVAPASATATATPTPTGSAATTAPTGTTPAATTPAATTPAATTPAAATAASTSKSASDFGSRRIAGTTTPTPTTPAPTTAAAPTAATTSAAAPATTPAASATPSAGSSAATATSANPLANLGFAVPTSETAFNALTADQQAALQAAAAKFDCASTTDDTNAKYLLACDAKTGATTVFLLGPVIVPGTEIKTASAQAPNTSGTGGSLQWTVDLSLKATGQTAWAKYTGANNTSGQTTTSGPTSCGAAAAASGATTAATPCADFVAFTLDGVVISSPYNESAINGQDTSISGNFTESTATDLANKLKYGALPLSFENQSTSSVTATLGSAQLKAGLLAGGIGLALVVLYSLFYYRALGLVTIASLLVSGVLTYACLVILGKQIGFTLTLAGIAGFIVAVGITADSFVVFFERLKDEVHEGRSIRVAVPRAWVRARRTILSADTVSFIAAAVLYYFAAGDVKGFAFTLGLSTILDLVVVFLFTHPVVSLLSRSRAFGSARFTGLNAIRAAGAAEAAVSSRTTSTADATPAGASRTTSAAVSSGSASERARVRRGLSPVAVAERSDFEADDDEPDGDEPDDGSDDTRRIVDLGKSADPSGGSRVRSTGSTAFDPDATVPSVDTDPAGDETTIRNRTAPLAGSAAERAAARREKLRAAKAAEKEKR